LLISQGRDGPSGPQGFNGLNGSDGKDAYISKEDLVCLEPNNAYERKIEPKYSETFQSRKSNLMNHQNSFKLSIDLTCFRNKKLKEFLGEENFVVRIIPVFDESLVSNICTQLGLPYTYRISVGNSPSVRWNCATDEEFVILLKESWAETQDTVHLILSWNKTGYEIKAKLGFISKNLLSSKQDVQTRWYHINIEFTTVVFKYSVKETVEEFKSATQFGSLDSNESDQSKTFVMDTNNNTYVLTRQQVSSSEFLTNLFDVTDVNDVLVPLNNLGISLKIMVHIMTYLKTKNLPLCDLCDLPELVQAAHKLSIPLLTKQLVLKQVANKELSNKFKVEIIHKICATNQVNTI